MVNWFYSDDALDVRNEFLGVKTIIYVEGDDDVLFWQKIFSKVTNEEFEIEAVGGANELDFYIEKINTNQLNSILAARDADFLPLLNTNKLNPKILHTYGYSIENSLYDHQAITQLTQSWSRSMAITELEVRDWLEKFLVDISPLIHLDAANFLSKQGLETLGDNCSRYTLNSKSEKICTVKVEKDTSQIKPKLPTQSIEQAQKKIGHTAIQLLIYVRGHFLATAAHRYIVQKAKELGQKVTISTDSLYAAAIAVFTNTLNNPNHPHAAYYIAAAKNAWNAL